MTTNSPCSRLCRLLRRFRRERKGNVAITFALATLPIIGFIGAAVDFGHANAVKVAMQSALDSTALMLAKDVSNLSSNELNSKALNYFNALFNRPEATNINITATYSTTGHSTILVNGTADVPTTFMDILGYKDITVGASSTTTWGTSQLRVALVLDNTGSMADDGKIGALQNASKSLLTILHDAAQTDGNVEVAIVPFANGVNVGTGNAGATWLDWTYYSNSGGGGGGYGGGGSYGGGYGGGGSYGGGGGYGGGGSWSGGGGYGSGGYYGYGGGSSGSSYGSHGGGYGGSGSGYYNGGYSSWGGNYYGGGGSSSGNCSWSSCWQNSNSGWSTSSYSTNTSHWQGCVMDRDQDYDVQNTAPTQSIKSTLFPAIYSTSARWR